MHKPPKKPNLKLLNNIDSFLFPTLNKGGKEMASGLREADHTNNHRRSRPTRIEIELRKEINCMI